MPGISHDVLDLDGGSQVSSGKAACTARATRSAWVGPLMKSGFTERDMPRAHRDLLCDVGDDHVDRDDAEPALVDGDDRAVPAQVLAPARRLREPQRAGGPVGHQETGVALQRRQGVALGGAERDLPRTVDHPEGGMRRLGPHALGEREDVRLVLASDDGVHAEPAQSPGVHRRIQTVRAQRRVRRHGADLRQHLECDPGCGVHGKIDPHHAGFGECLGGQALDGQIAASDVEPRVVQPARGLGEAERLATQLVGTDQDDAGHAVMSRAGVTEVARARASSIARRSVEDSPHVAPISRRPRIDAIRSSPSTSRHGPRAAGALDLRCFRHTVERRTRSAIGGGAP